MLGRIDEATASLHSILTADPRDARSHLLLCRAWFALDSIDSAVNECEAAIASGGATDSRTQDWMGRAYGRKADKVNSISAFGLARKVKAAFERAVELDPRNPDAVNDLSEYYVGAPSIVGGGLDKAEALAARVEHSLPQSAHRIRALAAEKSGDFARAETEFRAATSGNKPDAWVDLGNFYKRRHQPDDSVAALRKAVVADTARDASLVDVASILIEMHREPRLAEQVLHDYLLSNARSDSAPAFHAYTLLGNLLAARGDKPGARQQFQSALALASAYSPARKALHTL